MISSAMRESENVGAPTRVLVVEDDHIVRRALTEMLTRETFHVCAVGDGTAVQHQAEAFRPDIAIVDIGLPGPMTGFDVARWLKSRSDVPVIFLTAADALEDRLRGFELGADDYLVKPFAMSELVAR